MEDIEGARIVRENDYLKLRCAQLQDDVINLSGQVVRLRQELERLHGVRGFKGEPAGGPS
jgi:hypothetical protein